MHIIEHSPTRLILQQRRPMMGAVMALFTLFSVWMLFNVLAQGMHQLEQFEVVNFISWLMWVLLGGFLTYLGATTCYASLCGTRCVFDRTAEVVTLDRPQGLHLLHQQFPIYAMSQLDVETDPDERAFGLFLVLRDRRRIPFATLPIYEEQAVKHLRDEVRRFLLHMD